MSESTNININPGQDKKTVIPDSDIAAPSDVSSVAESVKQRQAISSDRQIKFERAQKCLENAALVSKRIKEHRKATAELLGRPFEDDVGDTASEMATTMSEKTGYSVATDISTTMSVQEALNIPGISESLANTLKQKEILMERIKQYKEISKRPMKKVIPTSRRDSISEVDIKKGTENLDMTKITNLLKEKDNNLSIMQVKIKAMETTILDLQEKINEKDQLIEAKNKATTLIADSLNKKEKNTMDILEDTKEQMMNMQNKFIEMETEWKEDKQKLLQVISEKDQKIKSLEEANTILENSRFDISLAHSKLAEELDLKIQEIDELQERIKKLDDSKLIDIKDKSTEEEDKETHDTAHMQQLSKKIELLEQINYELRQANKELEYNLVSTSQETKNTISPNKKGSPLPTRKGGRNTASKMKSPWSHLSPESLQEQDKKGKFDKPKTESVLQSLNKEILQKEYVIAEKDALISELQSAVDKKEEAISELKLLINTQEDKIEKIDMGTPAGLSEPMICGGDNFKTHNINNLEEELKSAQDQITSLNAEIDMANKNMIKVKSNFKLKLKQMQKTIDNFSKVSDAHAEIVKLNEEIHQLTQKVAELEEEKGNLQLHLVDYDSGRLTESEVYKKLVEIENLAEARLKSISLLETQKFDLVQELHSLQQKNLEMEDKLADISVLQNEQVCSEIRFVQLEEQIDQLLASKKELELIIDNLKLDKEQLNGNIQILQDEKEELIQKLENYIQENIELTDKLEKLSVEKVSSAESIEIVESLTTQEKLELEEYNKSMQSEKKEEQPKDYDIPQSQEPKDNDIEDIKELKKKIELFTSEREEVMDRMNNLMSEKVSLNENIKELKDQCNSLKYTINLLEDEKNKFASLNEELNHQIEELKHERSEIIRETAEAIKPSTVEDVTDGSVVEIVQQDDKTAGDKSASRVKTVKQLTKEILKLKNTVKEREDEIADCQMKILSLEEQQDKHKDISENLVSNEKLLKKLTDENNHLKKEIETMSNENKTEHNLHLTQTHELLESEIQKVRQEYTTVLNARDARIHELENLLVEYEKQVINYSNTLQQKSKETSEYINQITKLNDLSQKLKSTIDVLEEEKAKDQNAELIKSLNKQISLYQKTLADYEEKLRILEEEKVQFLSLKSKLEHKNSNLETELKNLQELITNKEAKQAEELSTITLQAKERDEEIHEIKLQLRKESIENEKLHNIVVQKSNEINELNKQFESTKTKLNSVSVDQNSQNEQFHALENKNKELMEKLKKFAVNIKKKSAMYTELENQLLETQKQLENKNEQYEQLLIQVETIPALHEKLKHAEEEFNRMQSLKIVIEQKSEEILQLQSLIEDFHKNNANDAETITKLNDTLDALKKDLCFTREENNNLKAQLEILNNKLVEYEIEQKNNANLLTKISCLESDIYQKQQQISDVTTQIDIQNEKLMQVQFGHEAKVQERDVYIESLQSEIDKYINRINRLEHSISTMEDRRQTLERKADDLDNQLNEKQKSYSEYKDQEDELVTRLAVLIDSDRVVEKQLKELESENKELRFKVQNRNEEYQNLEKSYLELQNKCESLKTIASKNNSLEAEILSYQTNIRELDSNLKKITNEHNVLLAQKKKDIEEIETEFNLQIEASIKEKKNLSDKYEKICEYVSELESELNKYRTTTESLNINIDELSQENQRLLRKTNEEEKEVTPDYTEQYISEINRLNSALNSKNEEITEINNTIQNMQTSNLSQVSMLENKNIALAAKVEETSLEINNLIKELNLLRENNEKLQAFILQKDEQIKQIMDNKKLVFEMNIPKTEGMTISSTIEAVDNEPNQIDISSIQSQIIIDSEFGTTDPISVRKNISGSMQSKQNPGNASSEGIEENIVPKKTYLCYKENSEKEEIDPFNSDEGWGLETSEESEDVVPGSSHLKHQIQELNDTNKNLKTELDNTNAKLLKVLKKMKELKVINDTLSNELQLSRQISQSSILDMAIESELSTNLHELEKKVEELNTELNKEKRDKEALKKQNDVFKNANDRLLEMKEKMDNELQMWKYNFKQVNDKVSAMQWGGETRDSTDDTCSQTLPGHRVAKSNENEDLLKLEKENDELQAMIDSIHLQNKELSCQKDRLNSEIHELKQKLEQQSTCLNCSTLDSYNKDLAKQQELLQNEIESLTQQLKQRMSCDSCESLQQQLEESTKKCTCLNEDIKMLNDNLLQLNDRCSDLLSQNENLQRNLEEKHVLYKQLEKELSDKISKLSEEVKSLKHLENQANLKVSSLNAELEDIKLKVIQSSEYKNVQSMQNTETLALAEKYTSLEEQCLNLKSNLDKSTNRIHELEKINKELSDKTENSNTLIGELNTKIQNLNTENDQLLSTVTELRSSVASAMDQRGFEIAELWKQHLAQRESEFQLLEHDLRTQLTASETKYEQLFDNVQSSSQDETNKIIMTEQISSLQNKLKEKEEQLINMQLKYGEVINQLDILRSEMEDEKVLHENKLLVNQEEYEKVIQELNQTNKKQTENYENTLANLQTELDATNSVNVSLNKQIEEMRINYENKVAEFTKQLQLKESEIFQKAHDFTTTLTQRNEEFEIVRKQLIEYEKKVEELTYEKESELAIIRLKMHERTENFDKVTKDIENERQSIAESLKEKIIECTNLNKQIIDLNKVLEEYANRATEMQTVLESQELEIVTLKDELLNLENALRSVSSKVEKHVSFASDTKQEQAADSTPGTLDKELLDAVPRAELDLALYMLHQRDVRCEELTMELTQLLEERDTLQLRLSDSLRSYEELKLRCSASGIDMSIGSIQEGNSEMTSFTVDKEHQFVDTHKGQTSRSSSLSDPDAEKPKLQAKLSELRSVKHSRDVRLRQESEHRQLGMRLLQRDVANLPPEAVEQLAQAHHTLSRDTQSTPTVLLNWLRGKSTPKVVHM